MHLSGGAISTSFFTSVINMQVVFPKTVVASVALVLNYSLLEIYIDN